MKILNSVRDFIENFRNLLRHGNMLNLEGFLGGTYIFTSLARLIGIFGRGEIVSKNLSLLAAWNLLIIVAGVMMWVGAVQNYYRMRLYGCRAAMVCTVGVLLASLLSRQLFFERVALFLTIGYFLASLMWLYRRILLDEPSRRREASAHETGLANDSSDGGDDPGGRSGNRRRDLEIYRISAGAEKVGA